MNKIISLEAAAAQVASESTLALGGMTLYRRPMAFVRALLRRFRQTGEPNNLTLLTFTGSLETDLLIGAGMVRRLRSCYCGFEAFGLAPMFTYYANHSEIEVMEETEGSLSMGLRAQMSGVGFMPGRGWLGTDLPRLRPDVKTVADPYSGETLMAFPAIRPDVAVLHALDADQEGNVVLGANRGVDEELALTSKVCIVTSEKISPLLEKADLTAPVIPWVALAEKGALPTSCHPYYPMDGEAIMSYLDQVSDPKSFAAFLQQWL